MGTDPFSSGIDCCSGCTGSVCHWWLHWSGLFGISADSLRRSSRLRGWVGGSGSGCLNGSKESG